MAAFLVLHKIRALRFSTKAFRPFIVRKTLERNILTLLLLNTSCPFLANSLDPDQLASAWQGLRCCLLTFYLLDILRWDGILKHVSFWSENVISYNVHEKSSPIFWEIMKNILPVCQLLNLPGEFLKLNTRVMQNVLSLIGFLSLILGIF